MQQQPRPEHPNPQFRRRDWQVLNGPWEFGFDDSGREPAAVWLGKADFGGSIVVPYPYQSPLSGIGDRAVHPVMWYRHTFDVPSDWPGPRLMLHFGAIDYAAEFWLNGSYLGAHEGGYTPVTLDITRASRPTGNVLVVRAEDLPSGEQPRGKQDQTEHKPYCFAATSGIWQSVWLEPAGASYLTACRIVPDVDECQFRIYFDAPQVAGAAAIEVRALLNGQLMGMGSAAIGAGVVDLRLAASELWHPDSPEAYEILLRLYSRSGERLDDVYSYAGLRDVRIEAGQILLNGEPIYQRQVLDQGYWPDGIYTAPSDAALKADVEWIRRLGFNGVRKHQKVEDPRWLYWCDRLGVLVWDEMAAFDVETPTSRERLRREWRDVVRRDLNHPSVVAWVPFNESFGMRGVTASPITQDYIASVVADTRRIDPTRPVVDNSGWEHVDTDIADSHNYEPTGELFLAAWRRFQADPRGVNTLRSWDGFHAGAQRYGPQYYHPLFVPGRGYAGQPIAISEWGGYFLAGSGQVADIIAQRRGVEPDAEAYVSRYRNLIAAFDSVPEIVGDCWTQLTDIEDEPNGLLTVDRQPKFDPELIRAANTARWDES